MDDKTIIELYWSRNEQAIAETDTKYGSFLHRVALNILSLVQDAEECVNDTYHAAWNKMPPEEGCTAVAYTFPLATGDGPPPEDEVDFVADRPFLFVISYEDDLPLFAGVVNQP